MEPAKISKTTARRFVLGRQGLWPGRRWAGKDGTAEALLAIEAVQMDPLNVVARSHQVALWGRVLDYRPEYLDQSLYQERAFFDYGGGLFIYPMTELPYWRVHMHRCRQEARWEKFAEEHPALIDEVQVELRHRGPLGNRDLDGYQRVNSYRGRKASALALYYLWLTGEVMIHHRKGFERIYDFRERIVPADLDYVASEEEAEGFFACKAIAFNGLINERNWKNRISGFINRRVSPSEAKTWLEMLTRQGRVAPVEIESSKERWYVLSSDLPLLSTLEGGGIPDSWKPIGPTTQEEVTFLAPLDIVSARGRANWLFDFDYVWEVYKPARDRRWGYYTLPILYGDRLVARLDPKLKRDQGTLTINGFWLEDHAPGDDPVFASALAGGLLRFANFLDARKLNVAALARPELQANIQEAIGNEIEVEREPAQE